MTIASPCVKKCRLSDSKTHCISCYRTLDEIANWKNFTEEQKIDTINQLEQRKQRELLSD